MTNPIRLSTAALAGLVIVITGAASRAHAQVYADFETSMGTISVELFHADVPRTVANFVSLAEGTRPWTDARTNEVKAGVPFYDGTIIHRVAAIPTLIIQGGSPRSDGTDGPGYKFPDEFTKDSAGRLLHKNVTGALAMANSGVHTNGSQFFFIASGAPLTGLDDKHTVFGQVAAGPSGTVAQGQALIDAIATVPLSNERPVTPVVVQRVVIRRVGAEAEAFDPLAWSLPVVGGSVQTAAVFERDAEGVVTQIKLTYTAEGYRAHIYESSPDLLHWTRLLLGGGNPTTVIRANVPRTFTYSGWAPAPDKYLRVREIDYTALLGQTFQPLSTAASLRLQFSSPAIDLRVDRAAEGGGWAITGPPAASGQFSSTTYPVSNGDPGYFSPVLSATMTDAMPWTEGVTLKSLFLILTFDAGSTTKGYFISQGTTTASPSSTVIGKGVFTVLAP